MCAHVYVCALVHTRAFACEPVFACAFGGGGGDGGGGVWVCVSVCVGVRVCPCGYRQNGILCACLSEFLPYLQPVC